MPERSQNQNPFTLSLLVGNGAAVFCVILGLLTVTAWHLGWDKFIQLDPTLSSIKYETGLGFIIAGLGLWAGLRSLRRLTAVCGVVLFLWGGFNAVGSVVRYFPHLERLILDSPANIDTGPMHLSSAAAFLLAGLFLLMSFFRQGGSRKISLVLCHIEALVFALGFSAFLGCLIHLQPSSQWAMSPQAALGFLIFGLGLITSSTLKENVYLQIRIVLLIGFSLSLFIFTVSQDRENSAIRSRFEAESQNQVRLLKKEIALNVEAFKSVKYFFDNSQSVENEEFRDFVRPIIDDHPAILAVAWMPAVIGETNTDIKDFLGQPRTVQCDPCFPFEYVEPFQEYQARVGVDLSTEPETLAVLKRSAQSRLPQASRVSSLDGALVFRVFVPVYQKNFRENNRSSDFEGIKGFVDGVVSVKAIVDAAFGSTDRSDIKVNVYENTGKPQFIYQYSSFTEQRHEPLLSPESYTNDGASYKIDLEVLGQRWAIVCIPKWKYYHSHFTWLPWLLFFFLLSATLAFARNLWRATESRIVVENEVQEQTAELSLANKALKKSYDDLEYEWNKRREAEWALKESELLYKQVLDAITDMVLVKGPKSRIVWANKAFVDYYGMNNQQLKGIIDAPFVEPDYTQKYIRDDEFVFNSGKTLDIQEEPITGHDGRVLIVHTIKTPILDEKGKVIMTVGVSRDITEKKRAEEELKKAQAQVVQSEKLASIGELSAGIAHEIKNPLAVIILGIEQIEQGIKRGELSDEDIVLMIKKAAKRANEVILELLRFSRVSDLKLKSMDLNSVIENALTLSRNIAKIKDIEIKQDLSSVPIIVEADNIGLEQVLINLVSNAADAIEHKGAIIIRSYRKVAADGNLCEAVIEVEDNGCGMPPEMLDKIFEPFFTTKEQGKGTGLGLSTAYSLIQAHHGRIEVESHVGQGTVFKIILPCTLNGQKEVLG